MLKEEMELFHKNYQKLGNLILRSRKVFQKLNINEDSLNLNPVGSFRLLLMGNNRGDRIHLINSLIQRNLLNTTDLSSSTTSIAIIWGERERAIVRFVNEYNSDINDEELIQSEEKFEEINRLSIEIPVSSLHKYIPLNKILSSIDIFIEDSFCMDGIEIIDVEEIQSIPSSDEVKEIAERLKANLVLLLASSDEIYEIFKNYQSQGMFNNIFYIINESKGMDKDEKNNLIQWLKSYTRFKEEGIFFIEDINQDDSAWMENRASFEDIRNSIHQEHRKESLYKPLYELTRIVKEATLKIIPELYATAEGNAQDVEMIFNRTTAAMRRAQLHMENINDRVVFFMERIRGSINEEIGDFLKGLPESVERRMLEQSIKGTKNLRLDICKRVEEQIDIEMYEWIMRRIIPLMDSSIKGIIKEEEYSLGSFCYEIDNINKDYGRAKGIKQPPQKYISAFDKFSGFLKSGNREELEQYIKSINESLVSKIIFSKRIFVISPNYSEELNCEDISKCQDMILKLALKYIAENSKAAEVQITEEIAGQIEAFFEYIKVKISFEMERVQSRVEYLQEYKNKLHDATDRITECERELREIDNELIELVLETMGY